MVNAVRADLGVGSEFLGAGPKFGAAAALTSSRRCLRVAKKPPTFSRTAALVPKHRLAVPS